jgi:hypothetical protein
LLKNSASNLVCRPRSAEKRNYRDRPPACKHPALIFCTDRSPQKKTGLEFPSRPVS